MGGWIKMSIVWMEDPLQFTYLRERKYTSNHRTIPVKKILFCEQKRIIGYEIISHKRGMYNFRLWWLKTYDRDFDPEGAYKYNQPYEAVIPSSIESGKESKNYSTMLDLDYQNKIKNKVVD
jgi:hypothetical protein